MAKYLDLTGLKYFITKRIGKTDISKIGDGTCTGAISALNQSLGNLHLVHLDSQQIKGTGYSFSYIGYKTGYRLINAIVNYNSSNKGNYRINTIQYDDTNKVYVVFLNQTLASGSYLIIDLIYIRA